MIIRSDVEHLIALADCLDCSLDVLLGRKDPGCLEGVPYQGTIWHPITEEPPVGKKLIWIDCDGTCDSGRYLGDERLDEYCVVKWKDARWWSYYPGEDA